MGKQLNKRARSLIRRLNRIRHKQAKQIDILCNDMISVHRDIVKQLKSLNFSVDFYESLLGQNDLTSLLNTSAELIRHYITNSNVAVFLLDCEGFELHMVDEESPIEIDTGRLESFFTSEVVENICRSNRVCSLDDIFEMGFVGNLSDLSRISAAVIPLGSFGVGIGFILLYRSAENKITSDELQRLTTITPGLCRAIESCRLLSQIDG